MRCEPPLCSATDDDGQPCRARMQALGERDPSFGPNWRPGCYVFRCKRCGSLRAIDKQIIGKYVSPV